MLFSDITKHLARFRVGIAGAGGLGSNCAAALARSGVGTLVIADYDTVEESNLNRQFYFLDQVGMVKTDALKKNIELINPSIKTVFHEAILDRENIPVIFRDCDVIIEAFDRAEMKEMIAETVLLKMPGTPLILGSGMAGWGKNEIIASRKIDEFLYICGDESTEASDENPPMAPRVGIVANMQANIAVELLMKMK
ncbi:MAG: sulfur carrier protein ThiS adenylyltransferase ThiF [Ignavibacteriales bacterium]|nr:sulfur carrier protein ThiS adenylyltransferase ThiF [Ignavibacteriales bacterium]